jgi:hypothetical protein
VAERIPTGEASVFAGWADQYGGPETSMFNATLTPSPNGPSYDFGGRTVTQGVPSAPAGSDSCWWANGPYLQPKTQLASPGEPWYVQDNKINGYYGIDYLGIGPTNVTLIQQLAPALAAPGSSCVIQYPQQMSINSETGTGNDPPYATNMLIFTITKTTISVSRGGVSDPAGPRSFHF